VQLKTFNDAANISSKVNRWHRWGCLWPIFCEFAPFLAGCQAVCICRGVPNEDDPRNVGYPRGRRPRGAKCTALDAPWLLHGAKRDAWQQPYQQSLKNICVFLVAVFHMWCLSCIGSADRAGVVSKERRVPLHLATNASWSRRAWDSPRKPGKGYVELRQA